VKGMLIVSLVSILFLTFSTTFCVKDDIIMHKSLVPIYNGPNIVFWRPQKVGSSTLLSLLISYGYRNNFLPKRKSRPNYFCRLISLCALINHDFSDDQQRQQFLKYSSIEIKHWYVTKNLFKRSSEELISDLIPSKMSITHEICNLNSSVLQNNLKCAFTIQNDNVNSNAYLYNTSNVKEIFILRDPLARSISVYYFWGELFKLVTASKKRRDRNNSQQNSFYNAATPRLGNVEIMNQSIDGRLFKYHGVETTAPPQSFAVNYANKIAYKAGMPGPSYSWSLFSTNINDALQAISSDRIMTVVLERLDESLLVLSHYMDWSLADVVVLKHRKALSSHPKHTEWPQEAVQILHRKLNANGEYAMYNRSREKLDERLKKLEEKGVNIVAELNILKDLKKKVSEV
jgi:hypothetical protein